MSTLKTDKLYSTDRSTGSDENILLNDDGTTNLKGNTTVTGTCTATTFSGSGASLTNVPDSALSTVTASKLSGALPAISGANLTNLPTRDRPFRNLIINGSMNVHQRGTTLTDAAGGFVVDRFGVFPSGTDEAPTIAWHFLWDNGSDVGPWEEGHRGCLQVTNGNQTSKGGTDNCRIIYKVEAYDMANSGWDYTDSNSKITLSFWVKSSVAQNFYGQVRTPDGTVQSYPFETGSLTADTWTKITKTIPGNSNITIDHDTGSGLEISFWMYTGTDQTDNSVTLNQWAAYSGSTRTPDATSTWWDTNDCDLETTGWQLAVGDTATKFEFRPFGTELALCQRYYCHTYPYGTVPTTNTHNGSINGDCHGSINYASPGWFKFPVSMRGTPDCKVYSPHSGTEGKVAADGTDGNGAVAYAATTGCFPYRNNDNSGVTANAFIKAHVTADAEI